MCDWEREGWAGSEEGEGMRREEGVLLGERGAGSEKGEEG